MTGEVLGQRVTGVRAAYVDRNPELGQPLTHPSRWALYLVLDDQHGRKRLRVTRQNLSPPPPGPKQRAHSNGSIRSRSNVDTWTRYSSHSARLLRRKKSKRCAPRVSASSSDRSATAIASKRFLGSGSMPSSVRSRSFSDQTSSSASRGRS